MCSVRTKSASFEVTNGQAEIDFTAGADTGDQVATTPSVVGERDVEMQPSLLEVALDESDLRGELHLRLQ